MLYEHLFQSSQCESRLCPAARWCDRCRAVSSGAAVILRIDAPPRGAIGGGLAHLLRAALPVREEAGGGGCGGGRGDEGGGEEGGEERLRAVCSPRPTWSGCRSRPRTDLLNSPPTTLQ